VGVDDAIDDSDEAVVVDVDAIDESGRTVVVLGAEDESDEAVIGESCERRTVCLPTQSD
jgi:hypothetical protein